MYYAMGKTFRSTFELGRPLCALQLKGGKNGDSVLFLNSSVEKHKKLYT